MSRRRAAIEMQRNFAESVRGKLERYSFDVGILRDKPHHIPGYGSKAFAGQVLSREFRRTRGTLSSVSANARRHWGVNIYRKPWSEKNKRSKEIRAFMGGFFRMAFRGESGGLSGMAKRMRNLVQAVVRNPILRAEYGKNRFPHWHDLAGKRKPKFMFTGQLFKGITAAVKFDTARARRRPRVPEGA